MLANYISISYRYFKSRPIEALISLSCVSVAMGCFLIGLSSFVHGMPLAPSIPFLLCSLTIMFLYSTTMEHRRYKSNMKEVGVRYLYGAEGSDLFTQLFIEALLLSLIGSIIAITFIDIILSAVSATNIIISKNSLFDLKSMAAFILSIPALSLVVAVYPALNLIRERESFRLN